MKKTATCNPASQGKNSRTVSLSGDFRLRFAAIKGHLTSAELGVGNYFLAHPESALCSITEVVEQGKLGYGTIIRFCRKIGCRGFQDFKVLLGRELAIDTLTGQDAHSSSLQGHVQKIQGEIASTANLIKEKTIERVAGAINQADRVLVAGVAGSAPLAIGFNYRLSRIGVPSQAMCEGYVMAIQAALLSKGSVFFAISFSGATKDIISAAEIAKGRKAIVVSLTNFVKAPLANLANHQLYSATDRDPLACEVFSNVASSFVLDLVFDKIYDMRPDANQIVEQTYTAISDRRI